MYYKIGIDVGGTNTDAVLVSHKDKILAKTKQITTPNISDGIEQAIKKIVEQAGIPTQDIKYIMLGTTHCTNALVERKGLNKIGAIRIGLPASSAIPTLTDFPEDLRLLLQQHTHMVHGGYEFDGRVIHPLDEAEIRTCLLSMKGHINALAITGIFSKTLPQQELEVARLAKEVLGGDVRTSCSHKIGGLGLLERENSTILNAALQDVARNMVNAFKKTTHKIGLSAQLFIGQNDGTLMSLEQVEEFPILTISSGPTNSIRGAGALSSIKNGIVIDVGGTTADGGVLVNFFPRESTQANQIGGVSMNFRMPDIVSIGIGGGTIVRIHKDQCVLGPDSVGYQLKEKALAFNGDTLTLSDFFLAENLLSIDNSLHSDQLKKNISSATGIDYTRSFQMVQSVIEKNIEKLVDKLKTEAKDIPVIACGGGAFCLPKKINGASSVLFPEHMEVANAFGACIAQISSEEEIVINATQKNEKKEMEKLLSKAKECLLNNGASNDSIHILVKESIPLTYLPGAVKLKVKLCGHLAI